MRRASLAIGFALALATQSPRAQADDTAPTSPRSTGVVGRFGAVLAYRELFGVPASGGGLALALGWEPHGVPVLLRLRVVDARTPAGLVLIEVAGDLGARPDVYVLAELEGEFAGWFVSPQLQWGASVGTGLRF